MNKYDDIFVSFIVPVYNVEKYITKCVDSVINQQHRKLEIILVDDGSKDKSGAIIDELEKKDNRIRVIHQMNKGVSSARNIGLENAKGEYILFVDADDYIEPDYTTYFIKLVVDNSCEIGMNLNCYDIMNQSQICIDEMKRITVEEAINNIYLEKINVAVWNKIYKRSFLYEHRLRFNTEFWFGEGMLFNVECLQFVNYVAIGKRRVYRQFYNPESAMRKFDLESNYCGIRSLEKQKEIWKINTPEIEKAWKYHYKRFSMSILNGLVKTNNTHKYEQEYKKCKRSLRKDLILPLTVDIPIKQKLVFVVAAISPDLLVRRSVWKEKQRVKKYIRDN